MARSRTSAKAAGSNFERLIADWLAMNVDDRIDRRVRSGAQDKGDLANVRAYDNRKITCELKNVTRMDLPGWLREAETERQNAGDDLAVVIHKRFGNGKAGEQYVTMTVETFAEFLRKDDGL